MSLIGRILKGNFEILDKIGRGGMATVYRARQISLDRPVAVKVLSEAVGDIADIRKRFEQEARIIARLNHPNIVQVHDVCEIDEGRPESNVCIIMEYIDGRSLHDVLNEQRPLRLERALEIAEQVASGLAYAHGQGIIHRDIKPQNIMLAGDDFVKIMDFGIARLRGSSILTMTGAMIGTPEYMSPEQAEGREVDHRTDIYSLGVCLYVMTTGELPFTGDSPVAIGLKHLRETPRSPHGLNPAIPPEMEAALLKAMAKKPDDRYERAEDFRQALINTTPTTPLGDSLASERTVVGPDADSLHDAQTMREPRARKEPTAAPKPEKAVKMAPVSSGGETAGPADPSRRSSAVTWLALALVAVVAVGGGIYVGWLIVKGVESAKPHGLAQTAPPNPERSPSLPAEATPDSLNPADGGATSSLPQPDSPSTVAIPPRTVELAMRRLNEPPAADGVRARRALEAAQTAAARLDEGLEPETQASMLDESLDLFIEAVAYEPENWRHQSALADFLAEYADRMGLPVEVRDGLLRDARELVRRANDRCDSPSERNRLTAIDQKLTQMLTPDES